MKTTKSTLCVARMALRAARDCLPDHAKAESPKKFTQPQLLACLSLKESLRLDYRGVHMLLKEWSDRREVLDLTKVPHFTTLCPAGKCLLGDAGYESEGLHQFCRDQHRIRSIIPTTYRGRSRKDGRLPAVTGHYRRWMKQRFPKKIYGQRWQIETVFSMLKRNLGSALRARSYHSQSREIRLRILTHNLGILWRQ